MDASPRLAVLTAELEAWALEIPQGDQVSMLKVLARTLELYEENRRLHADLSRLKVTSITCEAGSKPTIIVSGTAEMNTFNNEFKDKVANVAQGNQGPTAQGNRATAFTIETIKEATADQKAAFLGDAARLIPKLLEAMQDEKTEPDHEVAIAMVREADKAVKAGDAPKAVSFLSRAGKWAGDVALKVTGAILAEVIMQSTGIKPVSSHKP